MIKGIHHVGINCRDMDRMERFYREAFGFARVGEAFAWADAPPVDQLVDVEGSAARGVLMRAGGCYIELFEYSAPPPLAAAPLQPHDRGYTHFAVEVTGIAAEMARLAACGMDFTGRSFQTMEGVAAIYGYDPEGNRIELYEALSGCDTGLSDL